MNETKYELMINNIFKYGMVRFIAGAGVASLAVGCTNRKASEIKAVWSDIAEISDSTKISAMYAAYCDGKILVAGGANFPDIPVAEGGQKAFYDHVYICKDVCKGGKWNRIGALPKRAAYGVGYSCGNSAVFAGGANAQGALDDVWHLIPSKDGEELKIEKLPSLPHRTEQAAGAVIDGCLYIYGGIADGQASSELWVLRPKTNAETDANANEWQRLSSAPEAFVQPIMAATGHFLYMWGGFDPVANKSSGNGYRYDVQSDTWTTVSPHPSGGTFTGACAVTLSDGRIACFGGVDKGVFDDALQLPPEGKHEYLTRPVEAYKFQRTVHIYDPDSDSWSTPTESERAARAGAAAINAEDGVIILGGEIKPGIRTARNSLFRL